MAPPLSAAAGGPPARSSFSSPLRATKAGSAGQSSPSGGGRRRDVRVLGPSRSTAGRASPLRLPPRRVAGENGATANGARGYPPRGGGRSSRHPSAPHAPAATTRKRAHSPNATSASALPATKPTPPLAKRALLDDGHQENATPRGSADPSSTQRPSCDHSEGSSADTRDPKVGEESDPSSNTAKGPVRPDPARDTPQKIATVEEAVERMRALLHIVEKISSSGSKEEREYYEEAGKILEKGLRKAHEDGTYDKLFEDMERLVWKSGPGLYVLLYKIGIPIKIGSSEGDMMERAKPQNHKVAYKLCDLEKLQKLVPSDSKVVMDIKKLSPPRLHFHEEKEDQRTTVIALQIGELFVSSLYKTSTGTAGELIMMWPSERIQQITTLRPSDSYSEEDLEFIQAFGYDFFLTWCTYKSNLLNRRKDGDEVLLRLLSDPSDGKFLKLYMLMCAFGEGRVQGHTGAIEQSVRSEQMQRIMKELKPHLVEAARQLSEHGEIAIETAQNVRGILATIDKNSDDYSHYKAPAMKRIVEAAVPKLKAQIGGPGNEIHVLERTLYDGMQHWDSKGFDELIPPGSEKVELAEGTNYLLRVKCTMPGGKVVRYLIIRSFFKIFAEDTRKKGRIGLIEAYIELLSYLRAGGVITSEHAEWQALILRSFLMEWEGLKGDIDGKVDGSLRSARYHAVGNGIAFGGIPKNMMAVSKLLGIGYLETADLRSSYERELFDALVSCYGVPAGPDDPTPVEKDFCCKGAIEVGRLPARECPFKDCEEGERPYIELVGKNTEDFLLPAFQCNCCAHVTKRREVELLRQRIGSGDQSVTDAQRNRVRKADGEETEKDRREAKAAKESKQRAAEEKKRAAEAKKGTAVRPKKRTAAEKKQTAMETLERIEAAAAADTAEKKPPSLPDGTVLNTPKNGVFYTRDEVRDFNLQYAKIVLVTAIEHSGFGPSGFTCYKYMRD